MPVMNVPDFQRFFRAAGRVDVDKNDLKRFNEFLDDQVYDLAIVARDTAKWNGRDVIEPPDLPLTKGLQERIREFGKLNDEIELRSILDQLAARPQLDVTFSEEAQQRLPDYVGAVSVALAKTFRVLDPHVVNPSSEHWDRAYRIFELLG
jgi:hypothetical protein